MYTQASEKIKVYSGHHNQAPIITVLDTNDEFDQLIVKDLQSNEVVSKTNISGKYSHHEILDAEDEGTSQYTVEMIGNGNYESTEITIIGNK